MISPLPLGWVLTMREVGLSLPLQCCIYSQHLTEEFGVSARPFSFKGEIHRQGANYQVLQWPQHTRVFTCWRWVGHCQGWWDHHSHSQVVESSGGCRSCPVGMMTLVVSKANLPRRALVCPYLWNQGLASLLMWWTSWSPLVSSFSATSTRVKNHSRSLSIRDRYQVTTR
jgi:hypothetical protein